MSSLEDYLSRVQSLVWELAGSLSADERQEVQRLVDHGEPAEGLRSLAWIIVDGDKMVPATVIRAIREPSAGIVAAEHMPDELDSHALTSDT
jgi:hypothetical protein